MITACPGCKGNSFELKGTQPDGSDYNVNIIQCQNCGTPIGVVGVNEFGTSIENLEYQLGQVSRKLDQVINNQIYTINLKVDRIETEIGNVRYQLGNR